VGTRGSVSQRVVNQESSSKLQAKSKLREKAGREARL
jgi:hypothetical protein